MGNLPIEPPVETSVTRTQERVKLDVPRLAAPRGRARGRARANLRGLIYRMSAYDSRARNSICHATPARRARRSLLPPAVHRPQRYSLHCLQYSTYY